MSRVVSVGSTPTSVTSTALAIVPFSGSSATASSIVTAAGGGGSNLTLGRPSSSSSSACSVGPPEALANSPGRSKRISPMTPTAHPRNTQVAKTVRRYVPPRVVGRRAVGSRRRM